MVAGYENLLGALAVAVLHQYLRDTRWLVQKRDINSLDRIRKYLSFLACAKVDPRASVVDSSTIPCAAQFAGGDHRAGVTRICSAYILSLTNREGTCRRLTGAWRKKGVEIPTEEQKLTGHLLEPHQYHIYSLCSLVKFEIFPIFGAVLRTNIRDSAIGSHVRGG